MRLTLGFVLFFVGALTLAIPNMTRRGMLFAVPLPDNFRESGIGRRSIAIFRALVGAVLIAELAALFLSPEPLLPPLVTLGPLLIVGAGVAGFYWQRRKLVPFAVQSLRPREAELSEIPDKLPWFMWLSAGPFVILATAAAFLYSNWESIPLRFPRHWGLNGQPDAWSARTVQGVFGPLVFGAENCAYLLIMAVALWFGARRSRFRRVVLAGLVGIDYLLALLFACIPTGPLLHIPIWAAVLVTLLFVTVLTIIMARAASSEPRTPVEATPEECWKGALIYYNPNDAALFVEKRFGLGYTLNFGNYWSWVLAFGLLLVVASAPLVLG